MNRSENRDFPYDIAISFAGEDRPIALQIFELLRSRGINVFYDFNEQSDMLGKNLIDHLSDIYSNRARYCLMLISKDYPDKPWTRLERRSAQARAFRQPEEYILPVRLDDTEVPGLPSSIGYFDLRRYSVENLVDQIVKKIGRQASRIQDQEGGISGASGTKYDIPLPQIAKTYTQLDKDRFIENAFEVMKNYFRQALSELKGHYQETETDLKEINNLKFIARIYVKGHLQCMCKIWLGNSFGTQSIQYAEGPQIDISNDNTMNDYLTVDQTNSELGLKLSAFGIGIKRPDQDVVSAVQAAEYLWRRFTARL
jgi:hypothetical protein